MLQVYKLYIGLSQGNHAKAVNRDQIIAIISRSIASFTVSDAQGIFRGKSEDTLLVTIAHVSCQYIKNLAYYLCVQLHQDGIGLEYDGHYHRITHDCAIKDRPAYRLTSNLDGEARRNLS